MKIRRAAVTFAIALFAPFLVSACESGSGSAFLRENSNSRAAIARYRTYVNGEAQRLIRAVQALKAELEDGDVSRAQSRYARARVRYAQVEPFAELSDRLSSAIDASGAHAREARLGHFHKIEKALWSRHTTTGMVSVAERLLHDAEALEHRARGYELGPIAIATGAARLLAALSESLLDGGEERYAHIDLVDVAGNLEGVEASFEAIRPVISDEALRGEIERRLRSLFAIVSQYGSLARDPEQPRALSPGVSFVVYTELSTADRGRLRRRIAALAQLFKELDAGAASS